MLVFSTHAFTEGDEQTVNIDGISTISTHAFTEGDGPSLTYPFVVMIFQLTPSRKATCHPENGKKLQKFQLTPSRKATANSNNFCC